MPPPLAKIKEFSNGRGGQLSRQFGYHWYTQFQMALEDISDLSESEEEEEEEEFLDARSNESEEEDRR